MIDYTLIFDSFPLLLRGAAITLQIAFASCCLGLVFGSVLAVAESAGPLFLRFAAGAYVALFRGTPMLVQILFVYYVLPQFGITIAPFWAASIAIGLNSAAYISQSIRAGIGAVPRGQVEAAATLGMTTWQTWRHVIFPQAFRFALPALGNELVTLVKDSSLASIIGVMELSKEASIIRSRTYDAFSILLAVSLIYLAITITLAFLLKKLEKRLAIHA